MSVKTLQDIVIQADLNYSDHVAFRAKAEDGYSEISFKETYHKIKKIIRLLEKEGISPKDKVGILSENRPEWALSYLAITYMGAIAIPLDAMLNTEELEYIIKDSGTKLIIISKTLSEKHIKGKRESAFPLSFLMEKISGLEEKSDKFYAVNEEDLAAIVYTSGTTGSPKGVMLSNKNIVSNVISVVSLFTITTKDNFLSVLPLHHMFECNAGFLSPFYCGSAITYVDSMKSYNILKMMKETKVTIMCGVPLLYNLFYDGIIREIEDKGVVVKGLFSFLKLLAKLLPFEKARRIIFSMIHKKLGKSLRFWVSGGAAIDSQVLKGFNLFGIKIIQGYGLTESSPILACNNLDHNRFGSVGRTAPGVEITFSENSEILARGSNIMKGYYKRQDLTDEVIKDGWLYTGDIGCIDKEGYIFITGRSKDVIVSGSGVNVYPDELEFYLNKIKGIKESCVLGVKVPEGLRRGMEDVFAVIYPDFEFFKKNQIDDKQIEKYINEEVLKLNKKLSEFKRIVKFKIRNSEFPKTSTRKIRKFQVRKEMAL